MGTDLSAFDAPGNNNIRRELSLSPDDFIICMVAYMYRPKRYLLQSRGLKGHEDVIDAVHLLHKQGRKVKVVFVGGEWGRRSSYFEKVKKYGENRLGDSVYFLGSRTDVIDIYRGVDISVCPSHSENVGSAVESLLMSVPTISSDVGGFPDLIKHNETGLLVEAKRPEQLAAAINVYYQSPTMRCEHSTASSC